MSGPSQTQALKAKVQNLMDEYEERLTLAGMKITLSKKYFEIDVPERTSYSLDPGVRLFGLIDRYIDKKENANIRTKETNITA